MRWTMARWLFTVLVLTSLTTLFLNTLFSQWQFQRDFLSYTGEVDAEILDDLARNFESYFKDRESWAGLHDQPRVWDQLVRLNRPVRSERLGNGPPGGPRGKSQERPRPPDQPFHRGPGGEPAGNGGDPLEIGARIGLYDANGQHLLGVNNHREDSNDVGLYSDGNLVGQLRLEPPERLTSQLDQRFASGQRQSFIWAAGSVLLLTVLVALVLAGRLTRPMSELAKRASSLTEGDYTPRMDPVGSGEIAELGADLNRLALKLESNRQARRQWASDISHELRTPLAIILAELQALEDGVRQYDNHTRESLQTEARRLNRLVHDLHELSMSDEGRLSLHLESFDLVRFLDDCLDQAKTRFKDNNIELQTHIQIGHAPIQADPNRLGQLINNLLENSLRYTDKPGQLNVGLAVQDRTITLSFEDSAPGVPEHQRAHILERLFRADASRSRASGGSGLGLALCKAIVEAHGGSIQASASPLGGLSIRVELPLSEIAGEVDDSSL